MRVASSSLRKNCAAVPCALSNMHRESSQACQSSSRTTHDPTISPLMRSRCGIDSVRYPVASCTVACNREASGVARRPLRCSRRVGWGRSGAWNEQPEAAPLGERTYYRRTHLAVRFSTPEIKNKTRSLRSKVFLECGRGVIPAPLLVVHSEEAPRC